MNAYAESTPEGWVLVVARDLRHPPEKPAYGVRLGLAKPAKTST